MLQDLPGYINASLAENQALLPNNPNSSAQIQAKIAMLQSPNLASDVIKDRRWADGQVRSMDNRDIPIVSLFPLDSMRDHATPAAQIVKQAALALEGFLTLPFPAERIRVWYGFKVGNSGGGGDIYTEDRGTYDSRTPVTRLPYDAILSHELAHSYIGSEALTQFLEVYTYNFMVTGSKDHADWPFLRGWTPGVATNQNVAALLDVYQLVGYDAMARGYHAIAPLRPAYGTPLKPEVIQAFVDQMPTQWRSQVSEKLSQITF